MATLFETDFIGFHLIKQQAWVINDRFRLKITCGKEWHDFYIIDNENHPFVEFIRLLSSSLGLYDDDRIRLLPCKNCCSISVPSQYSEIMFQKLEDYLIQI